MMGATAFARESSRTTSVRDSLDLFTEIDALPADESGELSFANASGERHGMVFVENRRVCWAAARGLSRRLSDLLAARAALDGNAMENCYRTCTREGVPLGEFLVERGILTAECLRASLFQHTVESLRSLLATGAPVRFRPRAGGYSARFTFSTAELLVACDRDVAAEQEIAAYFGDNGWGAAFARGDGSVPRLVALVGSHPEDATTVARVGRWAASTLDVASVVQDAPPIVSTRAGDRAFVALLSAGFLLAGEVPPQGTARILNRRATRRRARETSDGRL